MKYLLLSLLMTTNLFAQINTKALNEREGGGGDHTKVEEIIALSMIKNNLLKLEKFLKMNPEIQDYFREIDSNRFTSTIQDVVKNNKIILIRDTESESEIFDKYNVARTAVNYPSSNTIVYDLEKVLELSEKPEVLFVLNAHEILSLMGLEENDPKRPDQYMGYKISSRFAHFVTKVESYSLVFDEVENKPLTSSENRFIDSFKKADRAFSAELKNQKKPKEVNRYKESFIKADEAFDQEMDKEKTKENRYKESFIKADEVFDQKMDKEKTKENRYTKLFKNL